MRPAAITEGLILGSYRFDRFRSADPDDPPPPALERLVFGGASDAAALGPTINAARVAAEAQNHARDLQSLPANHATPTALAERASELAAAHESLSVEILGREEIAEKGMGGLVAVSQGIDEEPRLITLRHSGRGSGDVLGIVGKAVTFDSGGISIKPSAGMHEMKMDMSGGAAVIEAMGAIAELGIEPGHRRGRSLNREHALGALDAPGRHHHAAERQDGRDQQHRRRGAADPGRRADLVRSRAGRGARRGPGDAHRRRADRARLDLQRADLERRRLRRDGRRASRSETGELAWRLPLHPDYKKLTTGTVADLTNAASKREAGTIYAGSFLEEFVDEKPWVHLDIAGTAWDSEREYAGKGPTGFGVRLLWLSRQELSATSLDQFVDPGCGVGRPASAFGGFANRASGTSIRISSSIPRARVRSPQRRISPRAIFWSTARPRALTGLGIPMLKRRGRQEDDVSQAGGDREVRALDLAVEDLDLAAFEHHAPPADARRGSEAGRGRRTSAACSGRFRTPRSTSA